MTGDDGRTVPTRIRRWAVRLGAVGAAGAASLALGLGAAWAEPAVATTAPAATSGTPCAAAVEACMDLSARRAWLTDGAGHVVAGPFSARGGTSSAPTPVGTFAVEKKVRNYWSTAFDAPMPNSVFFRPGIAFHADNPKVASHGCVHLTRAASRQFFDTLQVGDRVQIVP